MWKFSVILCLVSVKVVFGDNYTLCCPPDYLFMSYEDDEYECLNIKTNETVDVRAMACPTYHIMHESEDFTLEASGKLSTSALGHTFELEKERFCYGDVALDDNYTSMQLWVVCEDEPDSVVPDLALGICMLITAFFLGLTAIVYLILPELRDLQGKSIISFCVSMGIGLAIMGCIKFVSFSDMDLCATRGYFSYYFILVGIFWTNAISIQIHGGLKSSNPSLISRKWRDYLYYGLYAWGTPAVFTIILAIVNHGPGSHPRPGIGLNDCWFINPKQQWIYMYSIMAILIGINLVIYIYTYMHLNKHSFSSGHIKSLKYKWCLMFRMFWIMGLPWIAEMISSLVTSNWFIAILDLLNVLQGIGIFLFLVILRKRVIKAMYRRGWLNCISTPVEKYLAEADDQEEDIIQHTMVVQMEESTNKL